MIPVQIWGPVLCPDKKYLTSCEEAGSGHFVCLPKSEPPSLISCLYILILLLHGHVLREGWGKRVLLT